MERVLKIAVMLTAVDNMSKTINNAVNNGTKDLTRFAKATSQMGDKAFSLGRQSGALALGVGAPLFMMAEAAEESEQATKKLEQVFVSMGETSGKSAAQAKKFAESLMFDIAVDDEQIVAVQTKLATFENVVKNTAGTSEIFERATKAAFDLEAAGFGEGTQNAVQLGKALQDPIKGMTALSRSGVTFTAAEKEKIKTMVESGKMLDAQKYLMNAIEKQVGGVAKASASGTKKIKIAFGEVVETLGSALLPILERFSKWFIEKAVPAIQAFVAKNGTMIEYVLKGAVVFAALAGTVSVLSFAFGAIMKVVSFLTSAIGTAIKVFKFLGTTIRIVSAFMAANPIIAIITAIALAAFLIYKYWDNIKAFFINLWDNIKKLFWKVIDWIKQWGLLFLGPIGWIIKYWENIKAFFVNLWTNIKAIFWKVVDWVKQWGILFIGPIGFIIKFWDKIVAFFGQVWDKVKGKFTGFLNWIKGLGSRFFQAGSNIVSSIWNGLKAKFEGMVSWFKGGIQKIRDMLPFSPAKTGPLKDIHRLKLVETIAQNIKPGPMVNAMGKAMSAVRSTAGGAGAGAGAKGGSGGGGIVVNFAPSITLGSGVGQSAKDDFIKMLKDYQPELMRVIEDAVSRRERTKFA